MPDAHKNFAYSTVATAPAPGDTGLSLIVAAGDGARFPAAPFNAVVCPAGQQPLVSNSEIVRVTTVAADTLTIARQQEGSNVRTILVGDQIFAGPTAKTFTDVENALGHAIQQGAILSGDAALTVNSTSQVTIAAAPQFWVSNAAGVLLPVAISSTALAGIAACATYTRLDQIVVDSTGAVSRLGGAESNGVTLANRTGVAAIPAGSRLLFDILVTTGGVLVANVRDRRPWARGAFARLVRTSSGYVSSQATWALIDATNLALRLECSGAPLRLRLSVPGWTANAGGGYLYLAFDDGGSAIDGTGGSGVTGTAGNSVKWIYSGNTAGPGGDAEWVTSPSPGSHLFRPVFWNAAANITIPSGSLIQFSVEEILKANANNGIA